MGHGQVTFGSIYVEYLGDGDERKWPTEHTGRIRHLAVNRKAQVTLCRSGCPDLYDLKNRGHRHGRLMKSWQHRTDILEVCSIGKRSAVIGKPVRQSFTVKLCRVSISVVCGIGHVVGLSYPAWGHSWKACGHSWTAYGWSWRLDHYNHSKLSHWCDFYVFIYFRICI